MLAFFEVFIKCFTYQNELNAYISARNPTSPADVERLIQEYNYDSQRKWL
jgi:hypothetical protein